MRNASSIDTQKLIADIKAIVTAAQANAVNLPARVQTQIQDLENLMQKITTAGKANNHQILIIIQGFKEQILQEINLARAGSSPTPLQG